MWVYWLLIHPNLRIVMPMPSGCVAVLEASPELDDKGAVLGSNAGGDAGGTLMYTTQEKQQSQPCLVPKALGSGLISSYACVATLENHSPTELMIN